MKTIKRTITLDIEFTPNYHTGITDEEWSAELAVENFKSWLHVQSQDVYFGCNDTFFKEMRIVDVQYKPLVLFEELLKCAKITQSMEPRNLRALGCSQELQNSENLRSARLQADWARFIVEEAMRHLSHQNAEV